MKPRGGYLSSSFPLLQRLEEAGADVVVCGDGEREGCRPGARILLVGSAGWYPATMSQLARLPAAAQPRALLWLTEPLPPPAGSGFQASRRSVRDLAKLALRDARANDQRTNLARTLSFAKIAPRGTIVASTAPKLDVLAAHGVAATFVPMGTRPLDPIPAPVQRDVDLLFLGDPNVPHRRRALRRLRRDGVDVTVRGAWHPTRGLWGDERRDLLLRTKLLLNVSRHPGNVADARLGLGAVHGAVTVSEPMDRPDPWVAGIHFVEASLADLPALVAELLSDEARRESIATAALRLARTQTGEETASRLVALLCDRS